MSMLLSIIIPVYNTKEYLEGCVRSVLACDCEDCEIILVDDGATDGVCPQLCDALAVEHPDLIRVIHQENQGLGGARNTGLEAARGEYAFFLDSDDKITPDSLTVLKDAIQKDRPQVVAFNFYSDDGEGCHTPMDANAFCVDRPFNATERPDFLLSLPGAPFRVWKKELFLSSGIRYPSRVWYEDLRTTTKLFALADSIVTIPNHLYLYLQRPDSIMHSANLVRNREIIDAFEDLLSWFRAQGLLEDYQDILCRLCIDHLYLATSVRVLLVDPKHPLLGELLDYINKHFPEHRKNPYIPQISTLRKLALRLLWGKHHRILSWLFRLKGL